MRKRSERKRARFSLLLVAMILLSACGNSLTQEGQDDELLITPTSTITVTSTPTFLTSTATLMPIPSSATATATNIPVAIPTSSTPVSSAPDEVRMAYALDGHLYFQEGSQPPLQLTNIQEYDQPIGFSENGEKILFVRGSNNDLFSINIDGSNEQPLAAKKLLESTNTDYDERTNFCEPLVVPHSPLILFKTCFHPDESTIYSQDDLFVVDTDTNQARVVIPLGYGGGSYFPSPDGKKMVIPHAGYVDLLHIDGRMIKHKLATYPISEPWALHALVHWTEDSKDLILALPINTFYDSSPPPTFEVWRYSSETGIGTQIHIDHLPSGLAPVWPSPDGNWLLHRNEDEVPFYVMNVKDGDQRPYALDTWGEPCSWSPDNTHFAYMSRGGLYIGSVNGPPDFIERGDCIGWLDDSRFVYYSLASSGYGIKEIDGESKVILTGGNTWQMRAYGTIVFYPPLHR